MRRRLMLSLPALALVTACGGGGDGGAAGGAPDTATPADLSLVGGQLEDAWGVECGDELVDMAGYTKRVCPIPDDLMSPGMSSNAVGLHAWSEREHVDTYREAYLGDGVLVVGDGWFVDAPSEDVAASVEGALQD